MKIARTRGELAAEFMSLPDEALVNEDTVMAIAGMSRRHLQDDRLKRIGIPYTKLGRLVRYQKGDVLAYMNRKVA